MGLYQPPLKVTQAYTASNITAYRTADPTTNSTTQNAMLLSTLISDLKAAGILS